MTTYAGLDVSQQGTQVCVVDARGAVLWNGKPRSDPDALARKLAVLMHKLWTRGTEFDWQRGIASA